MLLKQEKLIEQCSRRRTQTISVKPMDDRVLVRPIEPSDKTESGLYLPESVKEGTMRSAQKRSGKSVEA